MNLTYQRRKTERGDFREAAGFPYNSSIARQYCGVLGKQDNCQIAVSVSLACEQASISVAWQLYVPRE